MKKNIRKIKQELRNFSLSDFAMRRRRLSRGHRNFSDDDDEKATIDDLTQAILDYDSDEVERLIKEEGVDPNEADSEGYTPIGLAIEMRDEERLKQLVKLGADINARDYVDYALEYCPCDSGGDEDINVYIASEVIRHGGKPDGATLISAIKFVDENKEEAVEMLLHCKVDPNFKDSDGETPLVAAIKEGDLAIAKLLVEAGADVDERDIELAEKDGHTKIASFLKKCGDGKGRRGKHFSASPYRKHFNTPTSKNFSLDDLPEFSSEFFNAIFSGDIATIRRLIDEGEELNVVYEGGFTPLSCAASYKQAEVVQELINSGADVNMGGLRGYTAIDDVISEIDRDMSSCHYDSAEDCLSTLKCLLQNGAKIHKHGRLSPTPAFALCAAVDVGDIELIQLLINAGVDPNEKNSFNWSPLHYAESQDVAKVLLAAGADPNTQNAYGKSPLLSAAASGQDELVKVLLDAGADIDITNKSGDTPLIGAITREQTTTALLLIEAGADVNKAGERATPLEEASITGLLEVTKALIAHGAYKGLEEALKLAEERGHTKVASYLRQVIAEQGTRGSRRPRRRR